MIIKLALAFGAGFVSFLTPCVLPIIPGYISYISGNSVNELIEKKIIKNIQKTELKKGVTFTKEHQKNIDNARDEMLQLRMELRQVQFSLREDIDALKWFLSVLNIWGTPSLICLIVLVIVGVRSYRDKHFIVNKL